MSPATLSTAGSSTTASPRSNRRVTTAWASRIDRCRFAKAKAASGPLIMYGSLCRRNVPGEPEGTRGTSRTRTRGPDRSFNDHLVDIQVLHEFPNYTSQPRHAKFVNSHVYAVDVQTAQHQASSLHGDLSHNDDRPNGRLYSRGRNRRFGLLADDIDGH